MATIHIDRLLETCIKRGASDLHLHVGRPPTLRLPWATQAVGDQGARARADTVALMKSITPERNQQELQEQGGTDFGFEFGDAGAIPNRRLSAEGPPVADAAPDSEQTAHLRGDRPARIHQGPLPSASWPVPGDRPDRLAARRPPSPRWSTSSTSTSTATSSPSKTRSNTTTRTRNRW